MNLVEALAGGPYAEEAKSRAKILVWDIENSPAVGKFWGSPYNTNIVKVVKPSSMISFAARWLGDEETVFYSDFHTGHAEMIQAAWDLLNEADGVISYNGRRHDSGHANTEFKLAGYVPPSPYIEIDLYRVIKHNFKFQKNGLAFVAEQLEIGAKVAHSGQELWDLCDEGDPEAWALMKEYNIGDIDLTEDLYWDVLPWIPQSMHPHMALYGSESNVCGRCGSDALVPQGLHRTTLSVYEKLQCSACGGWNRAKKNLYSVDARGINK